MKAREIMTKDPEVVTGDDTIQRAAAIMRDRDIGFVPVVDDRSGMHLTGVITDRDIAVRHVAAGHPGDCQVDKEMSAGRLQTVGPDDDIERVMEVMQRAQVRRIAVVEDDNRIVGVIAQADLATGDVDDRKVEETLERISEPRGSSRR
jgi:CBS domain-containing protein